MNLNLSKMKKLLLTVIATIMMAGSISAQNVAKECVLIEAFTGIGCVWCPAAAGGIAEMLNQGLSVAPLAFHCKSFSPPEYATSETDARGLSFYGVSGYPTVVVDGIARPGVGGSSAEYMNSYKTLKAEYDKRIGVQTPYKVELTYEYNTWNSLEAKVVVTKVGDCAGKDVRLFIALTESHIQQYWHGGNEINAVVRDIITDAAGIELPGDSEEITASFDVRPYRKENCELVAWVQDVVSKEVYQAVKVSIAPTAEYDLALSYNVENLPSGLCSGKISPILTIENQGTQPLTSAVFNVTNEDGDKLGTYKWEGALGKNAQAYFELSDIKFGGAGAVNIEAVELNGGIEDKYPLDNTIVYEPQAPYVMPDDGLLKFQLKSSEPENLSIDIINMDNGVTVKTLTFSNASGSMIKEDYKLPKDGCYRIVLKNSKGNGIGDVNSFWGILDSKKGKIEVAEQGEKLFKYKYAIEVAYGAVGVEDVVAENINVYPNPAKSVVNVFAENLNKVTVFNSIGQVVYTQVADSDNMIINVESWTNGLYYINLETKDGAKSSQKVVVNK